MKSALFCPTVYYHRIGRSLIEHKAFKETEQKMLSFLVDSASAWLFLQMRYMWSPIGENAYAELMKKDIVVVSVVTPGLNLVPAVLKTFTEAQVVYLGMKGPKKQAVFLYEEPPKMAKKTIVIAAYVLYEEMGALAVIETIKSFNPERIILLSMFCDEGLSKKIVDYDAQISVYRVLSPSL